MSVDDDAPDRLQRYPPEFETWPRDDQVLHLAGKFRREGLIKDILRMTGLDIQERDIGTDSKLTKKELAAIYLTLEGINHDQ